LADTPIRAKPPTLRQRASKWVGRHRGLVRAAVVLVAGTAAGLVAGLVLLARAWDTAERHRAIAEDANAALRLRVYAAYMRRGYEFWQRGALNDLATVLAAYEPRPGADDLRGFEWHYLKALADARPRHVHTFPADRGAVYAAAFSPDGRWIATSGVQGWIDIWDARTFEKRVRLAGHFDDCNSLVFMPDGRLVSCGDDLTIRIWDVEAGRPVGWPLI